MKNDATNLSAPPLCRERRRTRVATVALLITLALASWTHAGPNLMAVGNYDEMPFRRAEGRDSFGGGEVVFTFGDPAFDFGRVVIRSSQPASIVRRDLFVGFTGNGLAVDSSSSRGRSSVSVTDMEIWLRVQGKIRGGKRYEWEIEVRGEIPDQGIPAFIPAVWLDGQMIGASVTINDPVIAQDDRIQRMVVPHGIVEMKDFETQTGAAWVVLMPRARGSDPFAIRRFSLREIDTERSVGLESTMPSPVRYVSIRNVLEDQIASILERGAGALKAQRSSDFFWDAGSPEASVALTGRVLAALAELDPNGDEIEASMDWLAEQWSDDGQTWSVDTVARQLYCLARHGQYKDHRAAIQRQVEFLIDAQTNGGGWGATSAALISGGGRRSRARSARVSTTHEQSFPAMLALREAAFAGALVDRRAWRGVMEYWGDARSYDGGFTRRVGGLAQATTSADTAMGAAALLAAVDISAGLRSRRCTGYLGSALQLRAVSAAIEWLDTFYGDFLRDVGSLARRPDPYVEAGRLQFLGSISGLTQFNGKDHFVESAQELVRHFDPATSMFGVRGDGDGFAEAPSPRRTAEALTVLGVGAAPPVCQRMVVGDNEKNLAQYSGDAQHLVRYLAKRRGRQFNWRRASIDDSVRDLVETPILFVNVVGPFEWSDDQWAKIRAYALAGGSVLFDIVDGEASERKTVLDGLERAFPEYRPAPLADDHPLFSTPTVIADRPNVQAIGNGFRDFVFLPKESWSCHFQVYDVKDHEASFQFVDNLLTYCRDGVEPATAFATSTYPSSAVAAKSMTAMLIETGGTRRAYPTLLETMDRLMRSNFRTEIATVSTPSEADVLWVSVTGGAEPTDAAASAMLDALRAGTFVLANIVSGNEDWDETFRGRLHSLDGDISFEILPRNDPVYTGEIAGTQGFNAVDVELRKALQTRFTTRGRCALFRIRYRGKPAGIYSAYDLSSGIEYHLFPDCRGVMPRDARHIAMNAFLMAYKWKLSDGPGA